MSDDDARIAVRTTLAVLSRLAAKTRSTADDVMVQVLLKNEARLALVVKELSNDPTQPPTDERVATVLVTHGIRT